MEKRILDCITSFQNLIDLRYHFVLGRAGKHMSFNLTFELGDCHHLMGLHYLADRPDRRNREKIIHELLTSEDFRRNIASSIYWDTDLINRLNCTTHLESFLDDNSTIFRYNEKRTRFYSRIKAEYLLDQVTTEQEVYLFIDKRASSDDRFCRSIFPKDDRDYAEGQARWALLHKTKEHISSKTTETLFQHKAYTPGEDPTAQTKV